MHSNPLTLMLAELDALGDQPAAPDRHRQVLQSIIDQGLHVTALNAYLDRFRGPIEDVDIFTSGKFLVLFTVGNIELSLIRYDQPTKYLYSSPVSFLQAKLTEGTCNLDRYRAPDVVRGDIFRPDATLATVEQDELRGPEIFGKGDLDVLDLHGFSQSPMVFLRLSGAPTGDFEWAFERGSLRAHSYSTIRLAESNLCGIFELLGDVGDSRTIGLMEEFVDHRLHFVRWKAIQAIGRRDRNRGLELASAALQDRHSDVRAAAGITLDRAGRRVATNEEMLSWSS